MPLPDPDTCYRAVQSSDARFDGWFFTAVKTTGIYCRPSCPAIVPMRRNVEFYPSAAAAQRAGYRACKRCRPDASPGSPEWDVRGDLVGRAMRLLRDGIVDTAGVAGLADRLGHSERQLHRALTADVGAGPLALARAQRAQTARVLLETTCMGITEVAFASGFASVRQFNETIQAVFARTPSEFRSAATRPAEAGCLDLRLAYRETATMPAAGAATRSGATRPPRVRWTLPSSAAFRGAVNLESWRLVMSILAFVSRTCVDPLMPPRGHGVDPHAGHAAAKNAARGRPATPEARTSPARAIRYDPRAEPSHGLTGDRGMPTRGEGTGQGCGPKRPLMPRPLRSRILVAVCRSGTPEALAEGSGPCRASGW